MGQVDFGENRVQNLVQRAAQIDEYLARRRQLGPRTGGGPPGIRWHMIGHMQRNKVRKVVGLVRLIHSLDSLRLAEEIQAAAVRAVDPVDVLVQVNIAGSKSKSGIAPAATRHLIDQVDTMVNIRVRGLMCMGEIDDDDAAIRRTFERCRDLFEEIRRSGAPGRDFNILSMGMSSDFEAAIECGANVVRVGSAIFGRSEGGPESAEVEE
jgi:hypothetical protein